MSGGWINLEEKDGESGAVRWTQEVDGGWMDGGWMLVVVVVVVSGSNDV